MIEHPTPHLFGREAELEVLQRSLSRVASGPSELVMIDGPRGGGKSALARSLRDHARALGGQFIYGRFEVFERERPYTGLAEAFRGLIRHRLAWPEEALDRWKAHLEEVLEDEARVLIDVLPELGQLISGNPVPRLEPAEARARFNRRFRAFVGTLTEGGVPLVVCFDDLQWADPASLSAIQARVEDRRIRHLMLVTTCRMAEGRNKSHLRDMLDGLEARGIQPTRMTLAPLSKEAIAQWLRSVMSVEVELEALHPLAGQLAERTGGNPLYLKALFRRLGEEGVLSVNEVGGSWAWLSSELSLALEQLDPDTLIAGCLDNLAPKPRHLMQVASVLGGLFHVERLVELAEISAESAEAGLLIASKAGFIERERDLGEGWYRFSHDWVQELAYDSINPTERARLHREAGQRLLTHSSPTSQDIRVFQVAFHLNKGLSDDPASVADEGRYALARINRQAARIARRDAAFCAAMSHLQSAVEALPEGAWVQRYAFTFELHAELIWAAWAADESDMVEAGFEATLPHARTALQQGGLYRSLIMSRTVRGDVAGASAALDAALVPFGITIPSTPEALQASQEDLGRRIHGALRRRPLSALLTADELTEPGALMLTELLMLGSLSQWMIDPARGLWIGSVLVEHALTHGVSPATPYALACWPPRPRGDKTTQFEARRLALEMARRFDDRRVLGQTVALAIINGGFLGWDRPTCLSLVREAFEACDAHGDRIYAGYALAILSIAELLSGAPVARLAADAAERAEYARGTGFERAVAEQEVARIAARRLQGLPPGHHLYQGEALPEDRFIEEVLGAPGMEAAAAVLWLCEARRCLVEGHPDAAWAWLEKAEPDVSLWEEGMVYPEMALLTGLTAAQLAAEARVDGDEEAFEGWRHTVQAALARLIPYVDLIDTYAHGVSLLRAELAWLEGDVTGAWDLMGEAIEGAQAQDHLGDALLAHDRSSALARQQGWVEEARRCLQGARAAAVAWGAATRVGQIDALSTHPGALSAPHITLESMTADTLSMIVQALAGGHGRGRPLDVAAEIMRTRLRAARVLIVRPQGGEWEIEGVARDRSLVEGTASHKPQLPEALLDQVHRSGEAISTTSGAELLGGCPCSGWVTGRPIFSTEPTREVIGVLAIEGRRVTTQGAAPTDAELILLDRLPEIMAAPLEVIAYQGALARSQEALEEAQRKLERLERRLRQGRLEGSDEPARSFTLISRSPTYQEMATRAQQVARTDTVVLLRGEPGTGKAFVARAIHQLSRRQRGPFVTLGGGRIGPQDVVAHCAMAEGGTLYIQEVSALAPEAQGELLRLLDVGAFRLVAATRHELESQISAGRLREDLYYRLSVFPLVIPPLRARAEDLPMIVEHMVADLSRRMHRRFQGVAPDGLVRIQRHRWPGNLSELENVLSRAAMIAEEGAAQLPIPEYLLPDDATEGISLGNYRLLSMLGQGGMGEVWKAQHRYLRRPAAVKLINAEKGARGGDTEGRQRMLRRFEREAQATAALRSPHSVELFDYGISDEGAFYYVMELLEGMDLQRLVERFGPQPAERVVSLLAQICRSLAEAHAAGLVHRDIKAANVYACRVGVEVDFVKVLDFGLVKHVGPIAELETGLTIEGVIQGTPAYMAPELALGGDEADHRVDLYALGCLGYWLLTGMLPFEAPNVMKLLMKHIQEAPTPPSSMVELDIPEALEAVIMSLLEKSPEARPQTAREVERALTAIPLAESWDYERAERWWRRHLPELF